MLTVYSLLYTLAMILMSPLFLLRREKYASGLSERLGNYPEFRHDERKVIWLHCVSVGETNAARPLVDALIEQFPSHRVVISTTTKTGQELARKIFADKADAVFYLPFDWKFSVRHALKHFQPSVILLMETEIWPRLIYEAKRSGAHVAIVNGRLSEKSFRSYSKVSGFVRRILGQIDLALMQGEKDAERIRSLGMPAKKTSITGNLKFDYRDTEFEDLISQELGDRFQIEDERVIVAASTHEPEEQQILSVYRRLLQTTGADEIRLIIAPRHPQRFDEVADLIKGSGLTFARRSEPKADADSDADVILLDSVGELREALHFSSIVFVGGSLIPHGGQSVMEPAALSKAIITGPYTHNFESAIRQLAEHDALIQLSKHAEQKDQENELYEVLSHLLADPDRIKEIGEKAGNVLKANRGATDEAVKHLSDLMKERA